MENPTTIRQVTFRVLPGSRGRARDLARLAGACRFVWNQVLADQEDLHRIARMVGARSPSVSFFTLGKAFTQLRRVTPWLRDLPFAVARHALKRQADAWAAHFKGQHGRPRFKSRHKGTDGFTIPEQVRFDGEFIAIPKIGRVRLRRRGGNPHAGGEARQATFKRRCGKWHCTIAYAVSEPARNRNGLAVGVDMNARQVAASDGAIHRMPDVSRLEARRRRHQRMVARRRKGSNRRERAKRLLAKTSARMAGIRGDWQHQASRRIADSAETVCVEALRPKAMTTAGGRHKAGLNRAVRDTGWAGLRQKLEYKAGEVVAVNPAYTSQTCHACGVVDAANRRSQAQFECVACGHRDNADVNAAKNIRASGIGASARGGGGSARPVKRETGSKAA